MDITNILNDKRGQAAAAAAAGNPGHEQHLHHHLTQSGHAMSETASDRGGSPHDSEQSRFSVPRMGVNPMSGVPNGMRYPSPTAMQSPMPMMHQGFPMDNRFDNGMMQQQQQQDPRPVGRAAGDGQVQKAFPCSSCGKGFARRSDLARHGKFRNASWLWSYTDFLRTYPQWCQTARLRLPRMWKAVHPEICLDCARACTHWREATHV